MSPSDDTNDDREFTRELSGLVREHLENRATDDLSAQLDEFSRRAHTAGTSPAPFEDDEFVRELSQVFERQTDQRDRDRVLKVLDEVSRELDRGQFTPETSFDSDVSPPKIVVEYASPHVLESAVEDILEFDGFSLSIANELPLLEPLEIEIRGAGLERSVTLEGRVVRNFDERVGLQISRLDGEAQSKLRDLPDWLRLHDHSERRRRESSHAPSSVGARSTNETREPPATSPDETNRSQRTDPIPNSSRSETSSDSSESPPHADAPERSDPAFDSARSVSSETGSTSRDQVFGASESTSSFREREETSRSASPRPGEPATGEASRSSTVPRYSESSTRDSGQLASRLEEELEALYERVQSDSLFEVLALHWSAHGEDVREAYESIQRKVSSCAETLDLDADQRKKLEYVASRARDAHETLSIADARRKYRDTLVDAGEQRTALRTLSQKLEALAMQQGKDEELRDTCRTLLELDPDHDMARDLLGRDR